MIERPRSLTDIRIAFPCPSCSGQGRTGSTSCAFCEGLGWEIRDASRLTESQLTRLRSKLPEPTNQTPPPHGQPQ